MVADRKKILTPEERLWLKGERFTSKYLKTPLGIIAGGTSKAVVVLSSRWAEEKPWWVCAEGGCYCQERGNRCSVLVS